MIKARKWKQEQHDGHVKLRLVQESGHPDKWVVQWGTARTKKRERWFTNLHEADVFYQEQVLAKGAKEVEAAGTLTEATDGSSGKVAAGCGNGPCNGSDYMMKTPAASAGARPLYPSDDAFRLSDSSTLSPSQLHVAGDCNTVQVQATAPSGTFPGFVGQAKPPLNPQLYPSETLMLAACRSTTPFPADRLLNSLLSAVYSGLAEAINVTPTELPFKNRRSQSAAATALAPEPVLLPPAATAMPVPCQSTRQMQQQQQVMPHMHVFAQQIDPHHSPEHRQTLLASHRDYDFDGCMVQLRGRSAVPGLAAGQILHLGPRLAAGSFGCIHEIEQFPGLLAKVFCSPSGWMDNDAARSEILLLQKLQGVPGVLPIFGAGNLVPPEPKDTSTQQQVGQQAKPTWLDQVLVMMMPRLLTSLENLLELGPLFPKEVLAIAARLMTVVRDLHTQLPGVIVLHRDIKPGNILLDAQGNVILADFGLAEQYNCKSSGSSSLCEAFRRTSLKGTPAYSTGELLTAMDTNTSVAAPYDGVQADHRAVALTIVHMMVGKFREYDQLMKAPAGCGHAQHVEYMLAEIAAGRKPVGFMSDAVPGRKGKHDADYQAVLYLIKCLTERDHSQQIDLHSLILYAEAAVVHEVQST